jgi:hypothetical protein
MVTGTYLKLKEIGPACGRAGGFAAFLFIFPTTSII